MGLYHHRSILELSRFDHCPGHFEVADVEGRNRKPVLKHVSEKQTRFSDKHRYSLGVQDWSSATHSPWGRGERRGAVNPRWRFNVSSLFASGFGALVERASLARPW